MHEDHGLLKERYSSIFYMLCRGNIHILSIIYYNNSDFIGDVYQKP